MQIHEISQPAALTEVDLVGPSSIFNVGREALKDPKSWIDSKALGAAQQRAADKFGKAYAPALAKAAQANIAPMAKQLAQGWKAIASQLPAPVASPATVPGTAAKAYAQQPAGYKAITTNQPAGLPNKQYKPPVQPTSGAVKTQPTVVQKSLANTKEPVTEDAAGDYRQSFINYAHKTLGARGVDTEAMAKDANTNLELNRAVDRIIATSRNPSQQQAAVEQYFTTALTRWNEIQQDPVKYNKAFPGGQRSIARAGTGASATPGSMEQEIKDTLGRLGITSAQLSGLTKVALDANHGSSDVKSTGNPVWDAIIKSAGMHPK